MHDVAVASAFVSSSLHLCPCLKADCAAFQHSADVLVEQEVRHHRDFAQECVSDVCARRSENGDDGDVRAASKKNYELCIGAANHIASLGRSQSLCTTMG